MYSAKRNVLRRCVVATSCRGLIGSLWKAAQLTQLEDEHEASHAWREFSVQWLRRSHGAAVPLHDVRPLDTLF